LQKKTLNNYATPYPDPKYRVVCSDSSFRRENIWNPCLGSAPSGLRAVSKTKEAGARALVDAIQQIKAGTVSRSPNREEYATYFSFPTAKDLPTKTFASIVLLRWPHKYSIRGPLAPSSANNFVSSFQPLFNLLEQ
ncbi:MAG: hypothetical protein NTX52_14495, partial [Planctomycetota bacterium]|nr:hypothetical protein [Planctomycetota bacterium]